MWKQLDKKPREGPRKMVKNIFQRIAEIPEKNRDLKEMKGVMEEQYGLERHSTKYSGGNLSDGLPVDCHTGAQLKPVPRAPRLSGTQASSNMFPFDRTIMI